MLQIPANQKVFAFIRQYGEETPAGGATTSHVSRRRWKLDLRSFADACRSSVSATPCSRASASCRTAQRSPLTGFYWFRLDRPPRRVRMSASALPRYGTWTAARSAIGEHARARVEPRRYHAFSSRGAGSAARARRRAGVRVRGCRPGLRRSKRRHPVGRSGRCNAPRPTRFRSPCAPASHGARGSARRCWPASNPLKASGFLFDASEDAVISTPARRGADVGRRSPDPDRAGGRATRATSEALPEPRLCGVEQSNTRLPSRASDPQALRRLPRA